MTVPAIPPEAETWSASPETPLCLLAGGRRRWAEDPEDPLKDLLDDQSLEVKFILASPLRPAAAAELRRRHPEAVIIEAESHPLRRGLRPAQAYFSSREECRHWLRKNFPNSLNPLGALCVIPPRLRRLDPSCVDILEGGLLDACKESATLQVHAVLKNWHRTMNQLLNLATISPRPQLPDLRRRDCVVVGAGPSLAFNAASLHDRGDAFVLCCDGALAALIHAGVRPDAVASLDDSLLTWRFAAALGEAARDLPLIAASSANHVLLRHWPGPVTLAGPWPEWAPSHPCARVPIGLCVGHFAVALALACGARRVILAGFDLAYRDGLFHAPGMAVPYFHDRKAPDECEVPDWDGLPLRTDRSMLMYLRHFEELFRANPQSEFIDATEGGARKQGCRRLSLAEALAGSEAKLSPSWHPEDCRDAPAALRLELLQDWEREVPDSLLKAFAPSPAQEDLRLAKTLCRLLSQTPASGRGWLLLAPNPEREILRRLASDFRLEISLEMEPAALHELAAALVSNPCLGILAPLQLCPPDLAAVFHLPLMEWTNQAPPQEAQRHRWIPGYSIIASPLHEKAWRQHIGSDLPVIAWEQPS